MKHEIIIINNREDKEEILNALSSMYTDEDFNGNNGEEYTWESALEEGFESNQEYLVNWLRKSELKEEKLIEEFVDEWLGNDGYYGEPDIVFADFGKNGFVCSIACDDSGY